MVPCLSIGRHEILGTTPSSSRRLSVLMGFYRGGVTLPVDAGTPEGRRRPVTGVSSQRGRRHRLVLKDLHQVADLGRLTRIPRLTEQMWEPTGRHDQNAAKR